MEELTIHRRGAELARRVHPGKGASEETREEQFHALRELPREHVGSMDWSFTEGLQLLLPSLRLDIQLPQREDGAPEASFVVLAAVALTH